MAPRGGAGAARMVPDYGRHAHGAGLRALRHGSGGHPVPGRGVLAADEPAGGRGGIKKWAGRTFVRCEPHCGPPTQRCESYRRWWRPCHLACPSQGIQQPGELHNLPASSIHDEITGPGRDLNHGERSDPLLEDHAAPHQNKPAGCSPAEWLCVSAEGLAAVLGLPTGCESRARTSSVGNGSTGVHGPSAIL